MDTEQKTGSGMGLWAPAHYQSCQTQAEQGELDQISVYHIPQVPRGWWTVCLHSES